MLLSLITRDVAHDTHTLVIPVVFVGVALCGCGCACVLHEGFSSSPVTIGVLPKRNRSNVTKATRKKHA